jgi:hypothetical protein
MTAPVEHTHDHPHGAPGHAHGPEHLPEPSEAGTVVLDIGPGAGAAVVRTPATMLDLEIEYRAAGQAWEEKHMAVRARHGAATVQYAAVFGPLAEGRYEFRVRGQPTPPVLTIDVSGGTVAGAAWPPPGP